MGSKKKDKPAPSDVQLFEQILGYLNFSAGSPDPQFLGSLNQIFASDTAKSTEGPMWKQVCVELQNSLTQLEQSSSAFADAKQAHRLLDLLGRFCPAYSQYGYWSSTSTWYTSTVG